MLYAICSVVCNSSMLISYESGIVMDNYDKSSPFILMKLLRRVIFILNLCERIYFHFDTPSICKCFSNEYELDHLTNESRML